MVPSMFDIWVMATSLVRGVSSFSNSSMRKLPSSSTGAHLMHGALALAQKMPRHDVGMMLHDREHDLVAGLDALAAERIGDEIDRFRGVAGEDDLFLAPGIEEGRDLLARALVGLGRLIGEIMQAAMHIGVLRRIGLMQPVEHGVRLLRRGGVVEIDQRLAIDLRREDREIRADAVDVIGAIGRAGVVHLLASHAPCKPGRDGFHQRFAQPCVLRCLRSPRRETPGSEATRLPPAGMPRAIR